MTATWVREGGNWHLSMGRQGEDEEAGGDIYAVWCGKPEVLVPFTNDARSGPSYEYGDDKLITRTAGPGKFPALGAICLECATCALRLAMYDKRNRD